MDKKIAGLLGAAAAVATVGGAQAAVQPTANALQTSSYSDLLAPIPNAVDQLRADNAARAQRPRETAVKVAENHHHHHESDQTIIIKRKHHHHHHHHHRGAFIGIPGVAGVTIGGGDHRDHDH